MKFSKIKSDKNSSKRAPSIYIDKRNIILVVYSLEMTPNYAESCFEYPKQ